MNFKLPNIDLISFWAGFLLASLFWFVILRITKLIPRMRTAMAQNRLIQQQKKDLDREHGLRLFTLRKAQSLHLASNLFPLESILIEPKVVIPAKFLPKSNDEFVTNAIYQVLPDMPEVPELVAEFPAVKDSLQSLLEAGQRYIGISAEPGFGKTTALCSFASQLCMKQDAAGKMSYLPIFVDYLEIESTGSLAEDDLIHTLHQSIHNSSEATLKELLEHANANDRLVLIIDSLDRLPLVELGKATQWLKYLKIAFPKTFIVTACDPFIHGELPDLGFEIFSLAVWTKEEKRHYLSLWKTAWLSQKLDETQKQQAERVLLWLYQEALPNSPTEICLRVWSVFAGLAESATNKALFAPYLKLCAGGWLSEATAESLAASAEIDPYPNITMEKALTIIGQENSGNASDLSASPTIIETLRPAAKSTEPVSRNQQQILDLLIANHFFMPISEEKLLFVCFPVFAYYNSHQSINMPLPDFEKAAESAITRTLFETKQLSQTDFHAIDAWLDHGDGILRRDHLFALNWLQQTEPGDPLREKLFRQTAKLLQDRTLPVGLRYRFLNALVKTHDPSIAALFTYFSTSADVILRQISALGLGLLQDEKLVPHLVKLSKDPSLDVQKVACIALNRIWMQSTQSALIDVVFSGEDSLRALVCELLSLHAPEGHQILQELTGTDNYLARRAAIYGLVHIQEPWVNTLLEKLSIEDTQWIVRDAAKFALEHPFSMITFIAHKDIQALEDPWTLQKAETYVSVLPAQGLPSDLLFTVLEKDTTANKETALRYLLTQPTPKLVKTLTVICADDQSEFRETALNALFSLSKRGFDINTKE